MRYILFNSKAEALQVAEEAYDIQCQRKHCPTPKKERMSRLIDMIIEDADTDQPENAMVVLKSQAVELVLCDDDVVDIPPSYAALVKDTATLENTKKELSIKPTVTKILKP